MDHETASMQSPWAVGALKPKKLENQSSEFLAKLAKDIAMNLVFTSFHIPENQMDILPSVFMPLALGALSDQTQEYILDVGMVYSNYSEAGPMGINGFPIFFSCGFLSKDDTKIVMEKVNKIKVALDSI